MPDFAVGVFAGRYRPDGRTEMISMMSSGDTGGILMDSLCQVLARVIFKAALRADDWEEMIRVCQKAIRENLVLLTMSQGQDIDAQEIPK